ncbi:MAG: TolC family protein, partial [Gammaproteobacteria bacterium]
MKSNRFHLIFVASICCWSQLAAAQDDLLNVYQRALQNDPIIREAENVYFATLESKPQALSSLLPQLSLSAGTSTAESEDPNPATNFQTGEQSTIVVSSETERDSSNFSLNLSQTIFDRGQLVTYRQADKRVARAMTDYEIAKQDLLIRVSEAYFNVLAAEDTLTAEAAAREAIGRQLDQAERRFEVGLIAITDVQESQAGYDLAIATEISAQRSLAT